MGVLLTLTCALTFGCAPALAAREYPQLPTLELPAADGGPFHDLLPNSVAVDDFSGETLVADSGTGLIHVFDTTTGAYLATWDGSNVTGIGSFGGAGVSVAADDATGRIYVFDSTNAVVDVLGAAGEYIETWHGSNTPAKSFGKPVLEFGVVLFPDTVTVDQANDRVLVLDREHDVVDEFEPTGEHITRQIIGEPEPFGPETFSTGLAIDEITNDVLVSGSGKEFQFGPDGEELPR